MEKKIKKKEESKPKREHPRAYPKKVVDEVIALIREGKTLNEILEQVKPRKRAVLRYARKAGLEIKK